jgi:hypothetical protein
MVRNETSYAETGKKENRWQNIVGTAALGTKHRKKWVLTLVAYPRKNLKVSN